MSIMTFGKYCGVPLESIPRDYLIWCVTTLDGLKELRQQIVNILLDDETIHSPTSKAIACPHCGSVQK